MLVWGPRRETTTMTVSVFILWRYFIVTFSKHPASWHMFLAFVIARRWKCIETCYACRPLSAFTNASWLADGLLHEQTCTPCRESPRIGTHLAFYKGSERLSWERGRASKLHDSCEALRDKWHMSGNHHEFLRSVLYQAINVTFLHFGDNTPDFAGHVCGGHRNDASEKSVHGQDSQTIWQVATVTGNFQSSTNQFWWETAAILMPSKV